MKPISQSPILKVGKDVISHEYRDLKSVRYKLLVLVAVAWTYVLLELPEGEMRTAFIIVSFMFLTISLIYAYGKKDIYLKMGSFELRIGNKKDGENNG